MDLRFTKVLLPIFLIIQSCSCFLFDCNPYERKLCPDLTHRCEGCRVNCFNLTQLDVGCGLANITTLPNNIFSNLRLTGDLTNIYIYLVSNGITSIEDNAFHGIESQVNNLDLEYNKLTTIPLALGKLHNLKTLLLTGNPIQTVTSAVTAGFGPSVTKFTISLNHMPAYPSALNNLKAVEKLELYDIRFDLEDPSIFRGLNHLNYLLLQYPDNFRGHIIPPGVLNLHALTYLDLYGGPDLNCDCSLAYLKSWKVASVQIDPDDCSNRGQTITDYIQGALQHC